MHLTEIFESGGLCEAAVPAISLQQALDGKMFGPVYHGTQADIADILATGFDPQKSVPVLLGRMDRPLGTTNGYLLTPYADGIAAPVHHLGFGSYFTTVKAIAKKFAGGTTKGMKTFYLATDNVKKINFGSANTMMRWWQQNGYNMTAEATRRRDMDVWVAATQRLTDRLRGQCDAVHFLGKSMRKLLDGDQVCVFDPDLIRVVDPKLSGGLEIGAKVTATQVVQPGFTQRNDVYLDVIKPDARQGQTYAGWTGVFRAVDHDGKDLPRQDAYAFHLIPPPGMTGTITDKRTVAEPFRKDRGDWMFAVKWQKGGVQHNYTADELQPVAPRR